MSLRSRLILNVFSSCLLGVRFVHYIKQSLFFPSRKTWIFRDPSSFILNLSFYPPILDLVQSRKIFTPLSSFCIVYFNCVCYLFVLWYYVAKTQRFHFHCNEQAYILIYFCSCTTVNRVYFSVRLGACELTVRRDHEARNLQRRSGSAY